MSDTAKEINARFWRKMQPGGEIDRILNGGEPVEKRPAASDEEIALRKLQIETQLAEYESAIVDFSKWLRGWKDRRPRGFRAMRRAREV